MSDLCFFIAIHPDINGQPGQLWIIIKLLSRLDKKSVNIGKLMAIGVQKNQKLAFGSGNAPALRPMEIVCYFAVVFHHFICVFFGNLQGLIFASPVGNNNFIIKIR